MGSPAGAQLDFDPRAAAARFRELLGAGRWLHQRPHTVSVPKRGGWGTRTLSVFPPEEQALHGALGRYLAAWLERHLLPSCLAFRPRHSVRRALRAAERSIERGASHAAEVDVLRCFDEISHARLRDRVEALGLTDAPLGSLVRDSVRYGAPRLGFGLAQGSPLSPPLCNAVLHDVDAALRGRPGYLRYADDVVVLCDGHEAAAEACREVVEALEAVGLRPNLRKTAVRPLEPGWAWLGAVLGPGGRFERSRRARRR